MRRLFSILLALLCTLGLHAQRAGELIKEDALRAGGVYYMYPFKEHKLTPAPKGYEPVYLSHYGRHGARYLLNETQYRRSLWVLEAAHKADALTPEGERLWEEGKAYYNESCRYRAGDLTPLGWDQHVRIAQEIYQDNRDLFKKRPAITAGATQVPRCIVSMTAFCQGLVKADPKLDIFAAASTAELDELNPHAKENPYRTVVPMEDGRYKRKDPWGTDLKGFINKRIDHRAICARFFKDPDFTKPFRGTRSFVTDLYDLVFNMQCTGTSRNLMWVFRPEELFPLWEINNYIHYMEAAPPATKRDKPALERLVADADAALASGKPSVRLRFGHDTVFLFLISALGADNFGLVPEDADAISRYWWNFRAPMAATMYLLFARNKKGDTLVKLVINGDEASLPLPAVSGPWYRWTDLKEHLNNL